MQKKIFTLGICFILGFSALAQSQTDLFNFSGKISNVSFDYDYYPNGHYYIAYTSLENIYISKVEIASGTIVWTNQIVKHDEYGILEKPVIHVYEETIFLSYHAPKYSATGVLKWVTCFSVIDQNGFSIASSEVSISGKENLVVNDFVTLKDEAQNDLVVMVGYTSLTNSNLPTDAKIGVVIALDYNTGMVICENSYKGNIGLRPNSNYLTSISINNDNQFVFGGAIEGGYIPPFTGATYQNGLVGVGNLSCDLTIKELKPTSTNGTRSGFTVVEDVEFLSSNGRIAALFYEGEDHGENITQISSDLNTIHSTMGSNVSIPLINLWGYNLIETPSGKLTVFGVETSFDYGLLHYRSVYDPQTGLLDRVRYSEILSNGINLDPSPSADNSSFFYPDRLLSLGDNDFGEDVFAGLSLFDADAGLFKIDREEGYDYNMLCKSQQYDTYATEVLCEFSEIIEYNSIVVNVNMFTKEAKRDNLSNVGCELDNSDLEIERKSALSTSKIGMEKETFLSSAYIDGILAKETFLAVVVTLDGNAVPYNSKEDLGSFLRKYSSPVHVIIGKDYYWIY